MTNQWNQVAADASGVRSMAGQSLLDTMGMEVLTKFFEEVVGSTVQPANTKIQLRGVDICVRLNSRSRSKGPVGIDAKVDANVSGNMAIEVLSQDRPNTIRPEPACGWIAKDSPQVAYYFPKTSELVMLDMTQAYPWLMDYLKSLVDPAAPEPNVALPALVAGAWPSGTPNRSYISYNLMASVTEVLQDCPGALYFDLAQEMGADRHEALTGVPLQPRLVANPPEPERQMELLREQLATLNCYDVKPQLDASEKERMVRWFERRARFSRVPAVQAAGKALQASRVPHCLPEERD